MRAALRSVRCPWCTAEVTIGWEGDWSLPFHTEPEERWQVRAPECVASGQRESEARALAAIRDAQNGRLTRAAHP